MKPYKILTKKKPEKRLLLALKRRAGRASNGRITIRHQGGGVKKLYRIVDFGEERMDLPAKVVAIEYDPYRTAFICLLEYPDKTKRYQLMANGQKVGDEIICSEKADLKTGNRMRLKNIPVGTAVFNIELEPLRGGKLVRSAGSSAKVLAQEGGYTHLVFPSTEVRKVPGECFASIGQVSFPEHKFVIIGKAGSARRKGRRPAVRGSAMNPCDHPHGGGEGRTSIGLKHPKTPWGKIAMGVKTRGNKWTQKYIIQRRKKK